VARVISSNIAGIDQVTGAVDFKIGGKYNVQSGFTHAMADGTTMDHTGSAFEITLSELAGSTKLIAAAATLLALYAF